MRLGIATCAKCPQLIPAEQELAALLRAKGIVVKPQIWNDPEADWSTLDAVLVRSIWDYHLHPEAFLRWLTRLANLQIPVWNPLEVLRWNHHKFYLRELETKGVSIVPSLFASGRSSDI